MINQTASKGLLEEFEKAIQSGITPRFVVSQLIPQNSSMQLAELFGQISSLPNNHRDRRVKLLDTLERSVKGFPFLSRMFDQLLSNSERDWLELRLHRLTQRKTAFQTELEEIDREQHAIQETLIAKRYWSLSGF